jgi:hypothetical protein
MVGDSSENVIAAHIAMANPLIVDMDGAVGDALVLGRHIREAKAAGHDGVIFKNIDDTVDSSKQMGTSYAVFTKDQIVPLSKRGAMAVDQPRNEHGEWSDTGASYENKNTKTAADISGRTPTDAPLKTFKAYHVTRRENVEGILKAGFDPRKFKPQWQNDNAVSLSKGAGPAAAYFSKPGQPFDTSKYALLEVTVRGRLQPQGSGDKVGYTSSPQAFTKAIIAAGYDGQDLDRTIYVHNVGAITRVREVNPSPGPNKVRGAEFNPDQPRDEHGQWANTLTAEDSAIIAGDWSWPDSNPGGRSYDHLRDPKTADGKRMTEILSKLPVHEGVTYRGIALSNPKDIEKLTSAKGYEFKLHSSSSQDFEVSRDFAASQSMGGRDSQAVILEMHGRGRDINDHLSEDLVGTKEVVIMAGTRYKFASISHEESDGLKFMRIVLKEQR